MTLPDECPCTCHWWNYDGHEIDHCRSCEDRAGSRRSWVARIFGNRR